VCQEDGAPVGFVALEDEGAAVQIAKLCVAPDRMGQGIGSALIRHAVDRAGHRVLRVGTGERNAPAVALYTRLGFVRRREREPLPGLRYVELERTPR
jgi:ribosomal protein S18 acetylase RimI-like enzyme